MYNAILRTQTRVIDHFGVEDLSQLMEKGNLKINISIFFYCNNKDNLGQKTGLQRIFAKKALGSQLNIYVYSCMF